MKTVIFTDLDYSKSCSSIDDVLASTTTNYGIIDYFKRNSNELSLVRDIYDHITEVKRDRTKLEIQMETDGYSRTLEEAILVKVIVHYISNNFRGYTFSGTIDVFSEFDRMVWESLKKDYSLSFTVSRKNKVSVKDIYNSSSSNKMDFIFSVILCENFNEFIPNYIIEGLEWLRNE
jgi:hypothetical protein